MGVHVKSPSSPHRLLRDGTCWLLVYGALWLLLSGASGWVYGLVCALAAAGLSLWLKLPFAGLKLRYLPPFLFFFFHEVVLGAWDVARRALHPGLPLDPAWVTHSFACSNPRVHLLLSAMVGLMPGTFSTHFDEQTLYLHVLDQRHGWRAPVERMEAHLARLLGASSP